MPQDVPERQNSNRPHDHPILVSLIGAGALIVAAIIGAIFTHGASGGGSSQPSPSSPTQASHSAKPSSGVATTPASPETLARALLTPADLSNLGHFVVQGQKKGTSAAVSGSGILYNMTFVSGDRRCADVLKYHKVTAQAWAYKWLGDKAMRQNNTIEIDEDIESFPRPTEAKRVMQDTRSEMAGCHTFLAVYGGKRLTFTHQAISVPPMGDEIVAHQLSGEAGDNVLVWNEVEIRSGADVVFIYYSPEASGTGSTAAIASAAWRKYSTGRR